MIKKIMVLAVAASAVAAVAVPASAPASWLHHGTPIQQDVQLGLTGQTRFQGALGGVECQVTSRLKLFAGQTAGTVETYAFHPTNDTANCKGLGGLAFCQYHSVSPTGLPWTMHAVEDKGTPKTMTTGVTVTAQSTGGFCPMKHTALTSGSVLSTPNQANTVSSMQVSGNVQVDFQTTNGTVDKETMAVGGTSTIESPNANTYSI